MSKLMARASWLALSVALAAAASAHAADGDKPTTVTSVTVTGAEAITTAPVAPPLSTAYSVSTITADQVRNLSPAPSITIQTLLNTQPSIFAFTNGPLGSATNINFRAFNSGQFAETYDGIVLNDVFNGGVSNQASVVNGGLLTPANIDSVEIFRGINNPAVSSYNSLGGTINYLPRRPTETFNATVGGSYGSFNTKEFHLSVNTGAIGPIKQFISFSHADSDGWVPNVPARNTNVYYSATYDAANGNQAHLILIYNHNNAYSPFQMPEPLLQQHGGFFQWPLNWSYEKDRDSSWMGIFTYHTVLSSSVSVDNKFFGGSNDYKRVSFDNPEFDEGQTLPDGTTQPYNLGNTGQGFPFWVAGCCGAFSYPQPLGYDPTAVFPDANGDGFAGTAYHFYGYKAYGFGWSPRLNVSLPHNEIAVGGNITYGNLHSREYWYGSADMPQIPGYNDAWEEHDWRVFASGYIQDDIKLLDNRLNITPGVKYLYAHTHDEDALGFFYPYPGSIGDVETHVSPTIGINYKPTDQIAAYFAFGQSIKFPDISAYYARVPGGTTVPPPTTPPLTIHPEHVNDYEFGVRYQSGGFDASLNLYREDFTDTFIDAFNSNTFQTIVTNGGSSRYQGVELDLREDLGERPWGDLSGYVNVAYNEAKFTSSFISDYGGGGLNNNSSVTVTAGEPLADIPNVLVNAGVVWAYKGWRFDAEGRYVGRQYTDNLNSGVTSTTQILGYFLMDLGLSKTVQLHGIGPAKSVKLAINVNNLFDKYYYNQAYTQQDFFNNNYLAASPGAPRSVMGTIEVGF